MADKILLIDDEVEIADLIEVYLKNENYLVYKFYTAQEALECIENAELDLAILDVMLPDMDGFTLCKKIREGHTYPIIMLTAKDEETDKITGLTLGADDYITKPFRPLELMARVKSQLRRYRDLNPAQEKPKETNVIELRNMRINKETHQVFVDGESIKLTPIEFEILYLLAAHPGRVFSTDEIFEKVWHEKVYEANNTVMVHIRRLRGKMKDDTRTDKIITTVWGVGYKIEN